MLVCHLFYFFAPFNVVYNVITSYSIHYTKLYDALGLKPIVVINKVDKPNCRPEEVHESVFDLMFSLEATEDQLDFPSVV